MMITAITTSGQLDTWTVLYPPGGGDSEVDGWPWGDVIDHQLAQTGVYTLVVEDNGLSDAGTYNITFLKIPGAVSTPEDPDGGPIASGETHVGFLANALDYDWFYLNMPSTGPIAIVLDVPPSGDYDMYLFLADASGGSQYVAKSDRYGNGVDEYIHFNAPIATQYYILVYPYDNAHPNAPYALRAVY